MLDILPILHVDFRKDITEDVLIKQCMLWWRTVDKIEWKDPQHATLFFANETDAAEMGWLLGYEYSYNVEQAIEWHEEYREAAAAAFKRHEEWQKEFTEKYNIRFNLMNEEADYVEADEGDYGEGD